MKQTKYRVYDKLNRYQQTYDAVLDGALSWAKTCASRTQGVVKEVTLVGGKEISEEQIWPTPSDG